MKLLEGKTAVITGAARGIGKEIALKYASEGCNIAFTDLVIDENGKKTEEEIAAYGVKCKGYASNAADFAATEAVVNEIKNDFGRIDILVNNAGGGGPKPFDMPMADFRRAYELNVFSFFHLSQLVAPEMEKNGGGVILTITSMAAENKNINMTSYASSKAAASHLVRNMAFDLGEKNIRVNGIAPGAILTDALKSVITPEIEQKMLQHTPIRRLGQPQDIANAALFLCSPAASWVSGQILTVSGGGVQELN